MNILQGITSGTDNKKNTVSNGWVENSEEGNSRLYSELNVMDIPILILK